MTKAKSNILCIFEGEKREVGYFESMKQHFFGGQSIVHCCYGNDLYELEKILSDDEDPESLDIFEVLKEHNQVTSNNAVNNNNDIFNNFSRDSFNQVYLFFDFEYHDNNYSPEKIKSLVSLFNEETELGKLFISYPMVEAVRDIPCYQTYHTYTVTLQDAKSSSYKASSATKSKDFVNPKAITEQNWIKLVNATAAKMNYVVHKNVNKGQFVDQDEILGVQLSAIDLNANMYVLSSYPMFLYNQFPASRFV
ncbi:hypothetical protein [Vibrio sinaloensis]|uniref:hypothetical protein n=1 Tax=Photobacterium sp. (strain ATCC 43367) TaxID=379097 RepID=UPI0022AFB904|nr:hypothetical protein [Vibrio sinaloensis]MCZ4294509.1 hypothetical protein [Vibrio sinaloensis]